MNLSRDWVYMWLLERGVPPRLDETFNVGESGDQIFWIITRDVEYADRCAAAVRRAGGVATVVKMNHSSSYTLLAEVTGIFQPPDVPTQHALF